MRIAYETWGRLDAQATNAVLVLHALTGDSHVAGGPGPAIPPRAGGSDIVGPGQCIDTDRWYVVAPNMLGGCQGRTGPASLAPDGREWGSRFPYLTIRDQVSAQVACPTHWASNAGPPSSVGRWAACMPSSGRSGYPDRVERVGVLAAPATGRPTRSP